MQTAWRTLLSLLLPLTLLAAPAWAGPTRAVDHALLQRSAGLSDLERIGATLSASGLSARSLSRSATTPSSEATLSEPAPEDLRVPSFMDLTEPVLLAPSAFPRSTPSVWRQGVLPSDSLDLRFEIHATLCFLISADLDVELPRLDAVDGETYFISGFEFRVHPDLALFVEDFQPSSGIVGGDDDREPAVARSWDGHQIALGARWLASDRVRCEAALVGYVLSRTFRDEALGAYLNLTFTF
ncbi:MAG: hypothetical protein JKY65_16235 [Planctomycetes bacterium]|nr:hypothetical protein [Planctomycetota bacterium]